MATAADALRAAIEAFPPDALRAWSEALGQPTFVGSSGRVFPRAMKASPLLRAWLRRLDAAGVRFALRHHWTGWDDAQRLTFETPDGAVTVEADATVLALGGASWPRLGSDGGWARCLDARRRRGRAAASRRIAAFWSPGRSIFARFAGQPLKRIALSFGDHTVRGEAIITESGTRRRRDLCAVARRCATPSHADGEATLHIALRPDIWAKELERRLDVAARQAVDLDLPAQGAEPVAGRDRPAAGGDARQARHAAAGRARAR